MKTTNYYTYKLGIDTGVWTSINKIKTIYYQGHKCKLHKFKLALIPSIL